MNKASITAVNQICKQNTNPERVSTYAKPIKYNGRYYAICGAMATEMPASCADSFDINEIDYPISILDTGVLPLFEKPTTEYVKLIHAPTLAELKKFRQSLKAMAKHKGLDYKHGSYTHGRYDRVYSNHISLSNSASANNKYYDEYMIVNIDFLIYLLTIHGNGEMYMSEGVVHHDGFFIKLIIHHSDGYKSVLLGCRLQHHSSASCP